MMPNSGPTKDVFPYNRDLDVFDRDNFNPMRSNGRLTNGDVNRVLTDLESVRRTKMRNNYQCPCLCCLLLGLILTILGIIMWFS